MDRKNREQAQGHQGVTAVENNALIVQGDAASTGYHLFDPRSHTNERQGAPMERSVRSCGFAIVVDRMSEML